MSDILIYRTADNDIRRDILKLEKLDEKTDKDIVTFLEAKESAKEILEQPNIMLCVERQ